MKPKHSKLEPTTIGDIMSTNLVTLDAEQTLGEAVRLFAELGISGAPVVAGKQLVGVLSTTDIIAVEASSPRVAAEQPHVASWGDWNEPTEWIEGQEAPSAYFLERWDEGSAGADVRLGETHGPGWDTLAQHAVAEAMTRRILSLPPQRTVAEAARFMTTHGVHRLLVMDGDRLLGLVTSTDVLEAVGERAESTAAASAPLAEPPVDTTPTVNHESSTSGYIIGPTDRGTDIGFRPRSVRGLDEW